MVKFGLVDAICPAILAGCGAFQSKETRLCERNRNTFTLNSYYIYPCSCFHFTVNEMSRNKTKKCPRRLTAVDRKRFTAAKRKNVRHIRLSVPCMKIRINSKRLRKARLYDQFLLTCKRALKLLFPVKPLAFYFLKQFLQQIWSNCSRALHLLLSKFRSSFHFIIYCFNKCSFAARWSWTRLSGYFPEWENSQIILDHSNTRQITQQCVHGDSAFATCESKGGLGNCRWEL